MRAKIIAIVIVIFAQSARCSPHRGAHSRRGNDHKAENETASLQGVSRIVSCTPASSAQSCSGQLLEEEQCCPDCAMSANGNCDGTINTSRCVYSENPPWTAAYTNRERMYIYLVLQRPSGYMPPTHCVCDQEIGTIISDDEPSTKAGSPGWEEWPHHMKERYMLRAGCCDGGDTWRTRSLQCQFKTPCHMTSIKLVGSKHEPRDKTIPLVSVRDESRGARLCVPRLDRKLLSQASDSGYFTQWLSHHHQRDISTISIYSDDCINDRLMQIVTPSFVEAVDISRIATYNGWYHHQMLTIKDCFARASAAGNSFAIFLDMDEMLVVPPGWSSSLAMKGHLALSFASRNACDKGSFDNCRRVWMGHRKYALRTLTKYPHIFPGYIHCHPAETTLPMSSGMFVLHFGGCKGLNTSEIEDFKHEASLSHLSLGLPTCPPEKDKNGNSKPWVYGF